MTRGDSTDDPRAAVFKEKQRAGETDDATHEPSVAEERDEAGDLRDEAGDQRDLAGDRRDHAGELRDQVGLTRDLAAEQRDLAAEQRDRAAERRDLAAERAETDTWITADALERAGLARQLAAEDRRRAASDRRAAAAERIQAELDRGTSLADRGSGARERTRSEVDRSTSLADRGASARDRASASFDGLAQFGMRAEVEEAHRAIVEQLQEAVMPVRPRVRYTQFAVSYLPSDPKAPTGGDLYDWHVLPSGEVHIAVVDVLGHGVGATKNALAIVHTLRLLTLQGTPLGEMIERTDGLLCAQDPTLVATAIVARYDPSTGIVRIASGGHPPAIHVSAATGAREISTTGSTIGWPGAGSDDIETVRLDTGDALILYSDGIVEARRDIIEGTEALKRHALELRGRSAEEMATGIMRRSIVGVERSDDSVVLVLRRMPVDRHSWSIDRDPHRIPIVRHEASAWLVARGVPETARTDLIIILSELAANAVEAARATVTVDLEFDQDLIALTITDDGHDQPAFDHLGRTEPDLIAEAGRGLFIIRKLADRVTIDHTSEGSSVRVMRSLRADEPLSAPIGQPCPPIEADAS